MRFLVDECTGPAVAEWLRKQEYEVFSIYTIIQKAFTENRILITNDKDFGERIYRGDLIGESFFCGWMMNERLRR